MENLDTILQEQFVGKIVEVKVPLRGNDTKLIPNKFETVVGLCTGIGYNEVLGHLQAIVSRMPIELKHVNDIKIKE